VRLMCPKYCLHRICKTPTLNLGRNTREAARAVLEVFPHDSPESPSLIVHTNPDPKSLAQMLGTGAMHSLKASRRTRVQARVLAGIEFG
jgi:hypothetical protein